jgi:hypothetical protein
MFAYKKIWVIVFCPIKYGALVFFFFNELLTIIFGLIKLLFYDFFIFLLVKEVKSYN